MERDPQSTSPSLNAEADSGSFSSAGSLAALEGEVKRRRHHKKISKRRRLAYTLPVIGLAVVMAAGIGLAINRFYASRFVRQPADFFSIQKAPNNTQTQTANNGTTPLSQTSQLAVNGDFVVGGNLALSSQGVDNLAATLTNKITLQSTFPGSPQAGNANITGTLGAGAFVGNGARLTNLNASALTTGTVDDARLGANVTRLGQSISLSSLQGNVVSSINGLVNNGGNLDIVGGTNVTVSASGTAITISSVGGGSGIGTITVGSGLTGGGSSSSVNIDLDGAIATLQGNTFNNANQLVQLNGSGALPAVNGSLLTNLNASALASGTLADARLSTNVTVQGNIFNGAAQLVQLNGLGYLPVLNGSNLTSLNASSLGGGTVDNNRLTSNIVYENADVNLLQGISDNVAAVQIQNSAGVTVMLNVDTLNEQVAIGYPAASIPQNYRLDINGDINVEPPSSTLLIAGVQICGTLTCAIQDGNTNYIQNGIVMQTSANIAMQSAGFSSVVGHIQAITAQTAKLLQLEDETGAAVFQVDPGGVVNIQGDTLVQPTNSTNALVVAYNNPGYFGLPVDIFKVDTLNNRVGIDFYSAANPSYTLDISSLGGEMNIASGSTYKIGGTTVCSITGCTAGGLGNNYIVNSTSLQANANYTILNSSASAVVARVAGANGQTADILQVADSSATNLLSVGATGNVLARTTTNSETGLIVISNGLGIGRPVFRVDTLNQAATIDEGYRSDSGGTAALMVRSDTFDLGKEQVVINQAGTGDLLQLKNALGTVLQVAADGTTLFSPTTNSVTAFEVRDPYTVPLLGVDSLNRLVDIGGGALSARLGVTAGGSSTGLLINNAGTGQSLVIQDAGTEVFSVTDTAEVRIQPSINTTTAMRILNASGSSLLGVQTGANSANKNVQLSFNGGAIGEVAGWSTNATNMNKAMRDASYAYVNGYIYRFGGTQQASKTVFTVESEIARAKVNADGTVGSWTAIGNILDGALWSTRAYMGLAYVNGGFMTAGGFRFNGTGPASNGPTNMHNGSEFAKLKPDGTLSPYVGNISLNSGAPGGSQSTEAAMVADDNGNLYYIGGVSDTISAFPTTNIFQYAATPSLLAGFPGGGSWPYNQNSPGNTPALPAGRAGHAAVTTNGYIYVIGGYSGQNGGSVQSTVYSAKMNGTGGAGSWSTTTALPTGRKYHCAAVSNGFMYVWGGNDGSSTLSSVIYAPIQANGTLGSWTTSTQSMPVAISNAGCFIANGRLYTLGGITGAGATTNAVYYASIARFRSYADIDLVGPGAPTNRSSDNESGSVSLNGSSYGGELTAGNIFAKGNLQAGGQAQFAGGLSVVNGFTVEGDALFRLSSTTNVSADRQFTIEDSTAISNTNPSRFFNIDALNGGRVGVNLSAAGSNLGLTAANAKLEVRGSTASQNLVQVRDTSGSAVNVMTIADGGATTFKNDCATASQCDATQAFRIQNTAGTTLFNVDTTGLVITLGSTSTNFDLKFQQGSTARGAILRDFVCTGTEAAYDIVEFNGADTVARTATANSNRVAGIVVSKPSASVCTTAIAGVAQVNFGANAGPATVGDPVVTSATAGAAQSTTTPTDGAILGNSVSAKDGSNRVYVRLRRD